MLDKLSMKQKVIVIIIIIILIVILGFIANRFFGSSQSTSDYKQTFFPKIKQLFKHQKSADIKTLTVSVKPLTKTLYNSGTIMPLHVYDVTSPVAGTVKNIFFKYGQQVIQGQKLFNLSSEAMHKLYNSTFLGYIKARRALNASKQKFNMTASLYKDGLVPRNNYESDQNNYLLQRLQFFQAKQQLQEKIDKKNADYFESLSLDDIGAVEKALLIGKKYHNLPIFAQYAGIALYSDTSNNSGGQSQAKQVTIGSHLKAGDSVLRIGTIDGFIVRIKINEFNINKVRKGQKAIVTSSAFPSITLKGSLDHIALEAISGEGLPIFYGDVIVQKLTPAQQKIIKIGMNVKVAIKAQQGPKILIPLNTVKRQNGHALIKVYDPKTKKIKEVRATTGETNLDSIVITSGLKPGDQVVIPYQPQKNH